VVGSLVQLAFARGWSTVSLEVDVLQERPDTVIAARGEIDLATVRALRDALDGVEEDVPVVIVDLSEVTFLDSSGLRVLAQSQRRLTGAHGPPRLRLVVAGAAVDRVFDVTGLRSFFDVYATQEDAVRGR